MSNILAFRFPFQASLCETKLYHCCGLASARLWFCCLRCLVAGFALRFRGSSLQDLVVGMVEEAGKGSGWPRSAPPQFPSIFVHQLSFLWRLFHIITDMVGLWTFEPFLKTVSERNQTDTTSLVPHRISHENSWPFLSPTSCPTLEPSHSRRRGVCFGRHPKFGEASLTGWWTGPV